MLCCREVDLSETPTRKERGAVELLTSMGMAALVDEHWWRRRGTRGRGWGKGGKFRVGGRELRGGATRRAGAVTRPVGVARHRGGAVERHGFVGEMRERSCASEWRGWTAGFWSDKLRGVFCKKASGTSFSGRREYIIIDITLTKTTPLSCTIHIFKSEKKCLILFFLYLWQRQRRSQRASVGFR